MGELMENEIDRIVRVDDEIKKITGLSRTTRWRLEKEGKFPKRLRLTGNRASGYRHSELMGWVRSRK